MNKECYLGTIARCQKGILGIITEIEYQEYNDVGYYMYYGTSFDGKAWQSKNPIFVASNINDYIARMNG